jgi:hypothetical protein
VILVGGREFMERVVKLVDRQGVSVAVAGCSKTRASK